VGKVLVGAMAAALLGVAVLAARTFSPLAIAAMPSSASSAPEAGVVAIAGPAPGRIRLLYARNGGMVLLREVTVSGTINDLALSADGRDLFVATDRGAYTLSTRTGRVEAEFVATVDQPGLSSSRRGSGFCSSSSLVPAIRS
jgi:hypothetical protein